MNERASWITRHPDMMGGRYCIRGIRMPVETIKSFARAGYTAEQIMREFPGVTEADIECALAFRRRPQG